jgi:thiamine-monophosphate kinase
MSEAGQVQRLREAFAGAIAEGALDLVDDAAALPPPPAGATRVICADQVIEGRHFVLGDGPAALQAAADAGWRAIVRNVSDVAAMGGRCVGFIWTLAIPRSWCLRVPARTTVFQQFIEGAADAARAYDCPLYGGDVASIGEGPMVASVTAFGDVDGAPLRRSEAQAGDGIFVSRPLGASAAGLSRLLAGERADELPGPWRQAHLRPVPETVLGPALVGRASACMDISDGLLLDLNRLCQASGLAAELQGLDAIVDPSLGGHPQAAVWAQTGGEDYALLFTGPADLDSMGMRVGTLVPGEGLFSLQGGERQPLAPEGWDHFD